MAKINKRLWNAIAILLMSFAFIEVLDIFKVENDNSYQAMEGFYKEKKNSLDAVYIGSSTVDRFWEPPVGWNDFGISVWSIATDSLPLHAVKNLLAETRKTQPDALYIININCLKKSKMNVDDVMIHRVVDYMHFSANKVRQINYLSDWANIPIEERLEFLFPFIRFHSKWPELNSWDFLHKVDGLKKGLGYPPYLTGIEDISNNYLLTEKKSDLTEAQMEVLTDLLDYCDQEKVKALFVLVPCVLPEKEYEKINAAQIMIQERGYPCWDILKKIGGIGIQTDTDFYNSSHTNIHGSLKFIHFMGQKLVEEYGFIDKRGCSGWESWDAAASNYTDVIAPYTLPIERTHELRDYDIAMPRLSWPKKNDNQLFLSWSKSDKAEFYEIYRKSSGPGKKNWELLTTVDSDVNQIQDNDFDPESQYTYTVVPGYNMGGTKYYGKFDYAGVTYNPE